MNRKLTPFALLLLSILCFLATAALYFNISSANLAATSETRVERINERVTTSIHQAYYEADKLNIHLNQQFISFSKLLEKSKYPVFIYRDGQLVFWSNHILVPELDFPTELSQPTVAQNQYGLFIVVPRHTPVYSIFVYVPLQLDQRIQNKNLAEQLEEDILKDEQVQLWTDYHSPFPKVYAPDNSYLFSLDFRAGKNKNASTSLQVILLAAGIMLFILFAFTLARHFIRKGKYSHGIIYLLGSLVLLRVLLLVLNLPFSLSEFELFDSRLYAASLWSPSIGDLGLNMLLLATIAGSGLYLFQKNKVVTQLDKLDKTQSRWVLAGCMAAFYVLLAMLFQFYYGVYHNSPLVLDINQSLEFTKYKVVIYGIMLVHTLALCMLTYILAVVASVLLHREHKLLPFKMLAVLAILFMLLSSLVQPQLVALVVIGILFWALVILTAQYRNTINFPYRTYLFVFLLLMVSAMTGAIAIYSHYQSDLKVYKQEFAFNLQKDNDVLGEYWLDEVADKIASDGLIQIKMMGPYVDSYFIKQKITRQYLRDYFDKYETNVLLFDSKGINLESADTTAATLEELLRKYDTPQNRTERQNLFLVKDPNRLNSRVYLKIINVPVGPWAKGTIVLQLTLKKLLPNSVVPELLVQQENNSLFRMDMLSYAIYKEGRLQYSEGEYDYATNFNRRLPQQAEFYRQGANIGNYHHLGIAGENGQTLVVTTEKYGGREVLSNFSFLFLMFIAGLLIISFLYLLLNRHKFREFKPNFGTKIQIFLNFGILLPLLLVSITTAGLVTASYKKDLMMRYEQRGEAIQENLSRVLSERDINTRRRLQREVSEIAAISETDINLYGRNGRLLVTSQPIIFETGLISKMVNPKAFAAISERQAMRVSQQEHAGNLSFNTLYLPLRSEEGNQELAGFVGIPFFDSEKQLDMKLIELITTTMNIFTVMFILFMLLTFFASRILTVPLRLLADKLKRTSLTGKNQMLAYEGADEIGMLVNEYNRMLLTLEKNKVELAMQEKEAAWREMARQVAHEIKNPLTPMKLSLQYLQKAIAERKPNTEQLIEKIAHTLITQINILNDIATSFSSFTSMPEPKVEQMDVAAALQKAADLHNDPATAMVTTHIPQELVMVMGDESLMVRTFNNLILNAIQAVPSSRKPQVKVALQLKEGSTVLISISDNGSGIPEEIRDKVFIPNFSTKYTGSGIGLAVAKKGIENTGGRIWFETEHETGTTFYISLPLANV